MGTDNLHHKRKAKSVEDVRRQKASRESYDKVLIVCEGQRTEPLYLTEVKDHFEINSANIRITGDCGSDPVSVFKYAFQLYQDEKCKGESYDRVYCVFDQDSYSLPPNKYQQALDMIAGVKPKDTFIPITSVPCFEYWILLHFEYTRAPFTSSGGESVCDTLIEKLRKNYWPEYEKAKKGTFYSRLADLDFAIANAIRSLEDAHKTHTENPSTWVHELVNYLMNIKQPK